MLPITPAHALRRLLSPGAAATTFAAISRPTTGSVVARALRVTGQSAATRALLPRAVSPSVFAANARLFSSKAAVAETSGTSTAANADHDEAHKVTVQDNKVHLNWADGVTSRFHSFWLRDHCRCPECYHTVTKQRLFNTFKIPRDVTPTSATLTPTGVDIVWGYDNHKSHFPYSWLRRHSYDPKLLDPYQPEGAPKITWNNAISSNLPEIAYKDIMESDKGLAAWLNNIHVYGFSFVSGIPVSPEATEALANRITFIRETHYGGFWDFTSDLGHGDTAYTDLALGGHTDTTYFTDPAGLQMFHMLYHDGEGGDNLLVDGFHCAKVLKEQHPESYRTLSTLGVRAHSAGDAMTHIVPSPRINPILKHDPTTQELIQIRFNNDDRSTLNHLSSQQVEQFYEALFDWNRILSDEKNMLWTKFQPGRAVIFDNWRVLHGRSAFTGKRRMCGAYTNWDDYRSRWRTLNHTKEELAENL